MRKYYLLTLLIVTVLGFSACHCKKKAGGETKSELIQRDFEKEGYAKATVKASELAGCNFLLKLENNKNLEVSGLTEEFQKDNLAVWIKYSIKKNAVSTCQAGQMVELSDIQLRQ